MLSTLFFRSKIKIGNNRKIQISLLAIGLGISTILTFIFPFIISGNIGQTEPGLAFYAAVVCRSRIEK